MFILIGFLVYAIFFKLCFLFEVVEAYLFLNVVNFNYIFLQSFYTYFSCIPDFASFSELQKEQRGEKTNLNLKIFSFYYKTLFKILHWNIRKLVSIVTRRGIGYMHFYSISLFGKSFSEYIWKFLTYVFLR